jgi:integrase
MKLMDQVRAKLRLLHYSWDTEQSYVRWIERYLIFHKIGDTWRHPNDMGHAEIERFLTHLAQDRHVSASTQNQAFSALLFLYQNVLEKPLDRIDALRAARTRRLPVVLSREEMKELLAALDERETREPARLDEEGELPHIPPQFRDASAGGRLGHPHGAGAAGSRGRFHNDDLYPRAGARGERGGQPVGPAVNRRKSLRG